MKERPTVHSTIRFDYIVLIIRAKAHLHITNVIQIFPKPKHFISISFYKMLTPAEDVSKLSEGCGLIDQDPWLMPFTGEIKKRHDNTKQWNQKLNQTENGLANFSKVSWIGKGWVAMKALLINVGNAWIRGMRNLGSTSGPTVILSIANGHRMLQKHILLETSVRRNACRGFAHRWMIRDGADAS